MASAVAASASALMSRPAVRQAICPSTSMLLLCDMQERFRSVIHQFDAVSSTCSFMVQACDALDIPTVVTEQYPKFFKHTVPEIRSIYEAFPEERRPPVFEKTRFSMITDEVDKHITTTAPKLESAIIIGIETHICVQQTCLELLRKGIDVHVIVDGVSSQRELDRSVALDRMRDAGATLTTSESVIYELLGDSGHPAFKTIGSFIKERKNASRL